LEAAALKALKAAPNGVWLEWLRSKGLEGVNRA